MTPNPRTQPLLTSPVHQALLASRDSGGGAVACSLDLGRTTTTVVAGPETWVWNAQAFPYLARCRERTVYYWDGDDFAVASRFGSGLIKLVPTDWGPPTFEIDGIKMLPTAQVSPYADAVRKVGLIAPRGKIILDTCGGLGYFAACCLQGRAQRVLSFEKNPDVIWLRSLNPWSPVVADEPALSLTEGDITVELPKLAAASVDAVLHDPPRFGIAGELYSQTFYGELARVLRPGGVLFHYTGSPNRLTSGRDLPREVATRLQKAGFSVRADGDGLLAIKRC
ncbi:MnmC family methyltransferase [Flagellatimonas centrodinii]|uniref:class I SAM-dependent methyltransferase n=1 Tax=Flagellatimonas centrodinii TaxID=2806210 RepID=UPI001FEF2839|nr:MnmC family methyltransferase [Flagellatimonas centrodinii]ULQ46009.1 MnmC family methyltransferase [Flagellatimonas centrodinii]